ncbi:hypothetical protein Patl1_27576 [Pistacia atlantica]|uniref:Uncharacterized protein n=1 Tax=Pistacia atlantica TaxID=434234 RepID=A0ACC1BEG7_9ROSI|nr:hypothetical protein Patl1_27576 [Pistacia atlantica]
MRHLTHHLKQRCNVVTFKSFSFSNVAEQNTPSLQYRRKGRVLAHLLQLPVTENSVRGLCCEQVHAQVIVNGLQSDTFLGNLMLHKYSKRKNLGYACNLFDKMGERNLISWSSMVSMYTQSGYHEQSLVLFIGFLKSGDGRPNEYILASVVRACTQLSGGSWGCDLGEQIHGFVVKSGFDQDVYVGTSLVDFYAKSGSIDNAKMVFDCLVVKSAVTWTTIISGYVKSGRSDVSLKLFSEMRETDVVPDRYVLSSVLSACSMLEFVEGGKQIHAHVLRRGTEMDVSVVNVLIDFYTKCGRVKIARRLFDEMVVKNVITWTTMVAGYMQNAFDREAMKLFSEMTRSGWKPDNFACTSVLTSCAALCTLELSRQIHVLIIKYGVSLDLFAGSALIDVYSKCSCVKDARMIFEEMNEKDIVVWNAMLFGYTQQSENEEALKLYLELQLSRQRPNEFTFAALITAASNLASLQHAYYSDVECGSVRWCINLVLLQSKLQWKLKCQGIDQIPSPKNQWSVLCPYIQQPKQEEESMIRGGGAGIKDGLTATVASGC